MNKKRLVLYFLGELMSIAFASVAMFWSAGRLDWWAAWGVSESGSSGLPQ